MSNPNVFSPSAEWTKESHINSLDQYKKLYKESILKPDEFWASIAERVHWYKKWEKVSDVDYKKAKINFLPLQPGDVPDTFASVGNLKRQFNYKPSTNVVEGVKIFVNWFRDYYQK